MKLTRLMAFLSGLFLIAGCASIQDRSDKYRSIIGQQFVARYDGKLCKMKRGHYDIVPYRFSVVEGVDPYGKEVAIIPAGTVVTVLDAKVSYIGGDWDFVIAELRLPGTNTRVVFEEMLGFSSVDPSEFFKLYAPLKTKEPNQSPQPTRQTGG
jgi:hypothetical protein